MQNRYVSNMSMETSDVDFKEIKFGLKLMGSLFSVLLVLIAII